MARNIDRNIGLITATEVPEDQWILGAVVVTMDEDGEYHTHYVAQDADETPIPEMRQEIDNVILPAWKIATCVGVDLS